MRRLLPLLLLLCSVAWANTPPTLSANLGLAAGTGSRTTGSVSWVTGDIVVAAVVDEGAGTESIDAPTATGLSFTNVVNHTASSNCALRIDYATAASSSSGGVTFNISANPAARYNAWVWVWHSTGGVGNNASQFTTTKTVSLTPAGGADSAIIWVVGDWAAGASPAATPTSPNETTRQATQDSTNYSFVTADITDQTSSAAVSYGVNYTAAGPFSIGVFEIKGTAGGGSPKVCTITLMGAGPC